MIRRGLDWRIRIRKQKSDLLQYIEKLTGFDAEGAKIVPYDKCGEWVFDRDYQGLFKSDRL
jgi:hypothetical protein